MRGTARASTTGRRPRSSATSPSSARSSRSSGVMRSTMRPPVGAATATRAPSRPSLPTRSLRGARTTTRATCAVGRAHGTLLLHVRELAQRRRQDARDLRVADHEAGQRRQHPDERRHEDRRHERVDRPEGAEHRHARRLDPDLLVGLTQSGGAEVDVLGVGKPAREGHLAGMARQVGRTLGEHQRGDIADDEREHGCQPIPRRRPRSRVRVQMRRDGEGDVGHRSIVRGGGLRHSGGW